MECTDTEPGVELDDELLKVVDYFSNSITVQVHLPNDVYTTEDRVCTCFPIIFLTQESSSFTNGYSSCRKI